MRGHTSGLMLSLRASTAAIAVILVIFVCARDLKFRDECVWEGDGGLRPDTLSLYLLSPTLIRIRAIRPKESC